jgi:hypothetical protein
MGGLLGRSLLFGVAAVIVVIATLLTWPSSIGPTPDERRLADLQRLSHAIEAFRMRQHVLPASLQRLPIEPAAPVHAYDPVTNRPYDYRPLGPLAYELCARFDAPASGERRDFWWHDAGRHCFALETRPDPKPPAAPAGAPAAAPVNPDAADSGAPAATEPTPPPPPSTDPPPTAPPSTDPPAAPPV